MSLALPVLFPAMILLLQVNILRKNRVVQGLVQISIWVGA
jgi:hypothetical protein